MSLVCKTLSDIFATTPVLSEALLLNNAPHTLLPCLRAWLKSHSSSVSVLAFRGLVFGSGAGQLGGTRLSLEEAEKLEHVTKGTGHPGQLHISAVL